jgi:hypothetical protein
MKTHWRDAPDGWFSYKLRVVPGEDAELLCQFWGKERGARVCDVLVDGRTAATFTLDGNHPEAFYYEVITIPAAWRRGEEHVMVRFQAHPGNTVGGLFDVRTLKPARAAAPSGVPHADTP